jgi:hypothetical protein
MTDIHERRRRLRARTARAAKQPRTHYLIAGLAVGGLWLLNGDKSLLYHAVQMLAVMSALTGLQIVLDRRHGGTPPCARLIGAKLALIAVAVGAEWLLAPVTSLSNTIVAAGLAVLVTAAGPALDRVAGRRAKAKAATGPDQARRSSGPPGEGISPQPSRPGKVRPGLPFAGRKDPMTGTMPTRFRSDVSLLRPAWLSWAVSTRKDRIT